MHARQLEKVRERLYSRAPLIGGWRRRGAARALARDGSARAMKALAEAVARGNDEAVREIALTALQQAADWRGISSVCGVWADTRHPDLTALLVEKQWVASTPPEVRVLSALKVGRLEVVTEGDAAVIEALAQACEDADPTVAGRARELLPRLGSEEAQEALCQLLIERDLHFARDVAIAAGYVPQNEGQRALFFFMTEQWERYELLDFDRQLLRTAYALAEDHLRQRIREKLRAAGRTDFLTIMTGEDYRARAAEMSAGELDFLLQALAANREWPILWKLVFEVPFIWGVRIVRALKSGDWQPAGDDQPVFEALAWLVDQDLPTRAEELDHLFPLALLQARARVPGRINDVAFSPARPLIAIGTGQRKLVLWNYQQAKRERVLNGFEHSIGHVTFTSDDDLLCAERTNAAGVPCAIYGWDGDRLFRLGQHVGSVTAMAPVGTSRLFSTGRDHEIAVWDVSTRRQVAWRRAQYWARAVCVSADSQQAALLHRGLELVTLPGLEHLAFGGSSNVARHAAFSPDSGALIVGKFNGDVVVYKHTRTGRLARERGSLTRHEGRVEGVKVLQGRSIAVTVGSEGRVQFTALEDHAPLGEVQVPLGQVTSLHVSPDESFAAIGNSEAWLSLWDLRVMDVQKLLTRPFARALPSVLKTLNVLVENENLHPNARRALEFADCVLRHRSRFDIEIGEAPTIMMGEFDIEID